MAKEHLVPDLDLRPEKKVTSVTLSTFSFTFMLDQVLVATPSLDQQSLSLPYTSPSLFFLRACCMKEAGIVDQQ